jgi:hypothetical protein
MLRDTKRKREPSEVSEEDAIARNQVEQQRDKYCSSTVQRETPVNSAKLVVRAAR